MQALATLASADQSVPNVDISSLVTFTSSTARLAVDKDGTVTVVSRSGDSEGRISVVERVAGTKMAVSGLQVDVSEDEVCLFHRLASSVRSTHIKHRWHMQ